MDFIKETHEGDQKDIRGSGGWISIIETQFLVEVECCGGKGVFFAGCYKSLPSKETELNSRTTFLHRRHAWTHTHSLYFGAGGFVFEFESSEGGYGVEPFIPSPQRLTLTAYGVPLLAQCGLLPDLDLCEIKDKPKTDGLAKALVLMQVSWMILQTISRVATHIPTSLLEVNTLGHILCAFVVYLLWWNKLREIHEPTILMGEWVNQLCAYMYMSSRVSGTRIEGMFKPRPWVTPEMKRCLYIEHDKPMSSNRSQGKLRIAPF